MGRSIRLWHLGLIVSLGMFAAAFLSHVEIYLGLAILLLAPMLPKARKDAVMTPGWREYFFVTLFVLVFTSVVFMFTQHLLTEAISRSDIPG